MTPNELETHCREYAQLMDIIHIGAYSEHDGNYWYLGENISNRLHELDIAAIRNGLQFVEQYNGKYALEAATQEQLNAYQQSLEG